MKPTSRQLKELIDNTNENEVTICRYIVERLDLEYTQLENKINKAIKYIETMYIPQDVISQKQELLDILKEK